jgi:hypothetical protein
MPHRHIMPRETPFAVRKQLHISSPFRQIPMSGHTAIEPATDSGRRSAIPRAPVSRAELQAARTPDQVVMYQSQRALHFPQEVEASSLLKIAHKQINVLQKQFEELRVKWLPQVVKACKRTVRTRRRVLLALGAVTLAVLCLRLRCVACSVLIGDRSCIGFVGDYLSRCMCVRHVDL